MTDSSWTQPGHLSAAGRFLDLATVDAHKAYLIQQLEETQQRLLFNLGEKRDAQFRELRSRALMQERQLLMQIDQDMQKDEMVANIQYKHQMNMLQEKIE